MDYPTIVLCMGSTFQNTSHFTRLKSSMCLHSSKTLTHGCFRGTDAVVADFLHLGTIDTGRR